ncbi:cytochrome c oxidase assembly factor Coa1 family protein [Mesonia ostreae]|uniref:Cytochrome c oxidase assembly factor Coa1 family protein n=1 Tax=Mesonia ostreae TaxID=861110 RepID=A0ABU2KK02_9FLAO|nr:cytochrome c oxidase assembly factor Coa1 family protein [Mesonia ostreae]MDT0295067.1 cytochrome c oxidase assembly factor Coa1 family protein [Mesonia ostreae]
MDDELIVQRSWWNKNWKWFLPVSMLILIVAAVFFSSGIAVITNNYAQAYSDEDLYQDALKHVQSNPKAVEVLGEIQPIDKLAILEGEVQYSNNNQRVNSTIRIVGMKGKARMHILANRVQGKWNYERILVRIKSPSEKRQHIPIISAK